MVARYKQARHHTYKKPVIIILIVVTIAAVGYGIFAYIHRNKNHDTTFQKTSTGHDVNLNPPTKEEKQEAEDNKDRIAADQKNSDNPTETPSNSPSGAATVKPFISRADVYAGNVEVAGYITGIFEEGGTCTATLTKGSAKVTATSKGFSDADHTTCTPLTIPLSQFTSTGTWSVTLSYSSSTASGTSEARNIVIQ